MSDSLGRLYLDDVIVTFRRQKDLADRAAAQLDDGDFFRTIDAESNSVAMIVKHVAGNLRSRWTDFLTTDGEKPDRDRDAEFVVAPEDTRPAVTAAWEQGWARLFATLEALEPQALSTVVRLRGEAMPALSAIDRSLAHVAQHVGQIVFLAKHLRSRDWKTLSIPRGRSREAGRLDSAGSR